MVFFVGLINLGRRYSEEMSAVIFKGLQIFG